MAIASGLRCGLLRANRPANSRSYSPECSGVQSSPTFVLTRFGDGRDGKITMGALIQCLPTSMSLVAGLRRRESTTHWSATRPSRFLWEEWAVSILTPVERYQARSQAPHKLPLYWMGQQGILLAPMRLLLELH